MRRAEIEGALPKQSVAVKVTVTVVVRGAAGATLGFVPVSIYTVMPGTMASVANREIHSGQQLRNERHNGMLGI